MNKQHCTKRTQFPGLDHTFMWFLLVPYLYRFTSKWSIKLCIRQQKVILFISSFLPYLTIDAYKYMQEEGSLLYPCFVRMLDCMDGKKRYTKLKIFF